jgi:hypothetical protein
MPTSPHATRAPLATFLGLTFALSAVFWRLIIAAGTLNAHGGRYVLALMWCPGVSALLTRLAFQRNVRGQGWGWCGTRWAALAYLLPVAYATAAYGAVWLTGLGGLDLTRFRTGVVPFVVVGSLQSLLSATGEELGWRGYAGLLRPRHRGHRPDALADHRVRRRARGRDRRHRVDILARARRCHAARVGGRVGQGSTLDTYAPSESDRRRGRPMGPLWDKGAPLGGRAACLARHVGHSMSPPVPGSIHSGGICRPRGQSGSMWYTASVLPW